jgi:hypothetical protein
MSEAAEIQNRESQPPVMASDAGENIVTSSLEDEILSKIRIRNGD